MIALKNEISNTETELISTISKYGEEHSAVLNLQSKLYELKEKIKTETEEMISQGISVSDPLLFRQSLWPKWNSGTPNA